MVGWLDGSVSWYSELDTTKEDELLEDMPWIDIRSAFPDQIIRGSWAALTLANDPTFPSVLQRGQRLVSVSGDARLEEYDRNSMYFRLVNVARYVRVTDAGAMPAEPPARAVDALLRCHAQLDPLAPEVTRVVAAPVFDSAGDLVFEPGYHASSGIYYHPDELLTNVDWSSCINPDPAMVTWAVEQIDDVIGDFPFAAPADRANAFALMLLPFVRDLIPGTTPVHAVVAPTAGTGKTWLVQTLLYPSCGLVAFRGNPKNDDEWRKALTTYLLSDPTALVFDNLNDLDSEHLAAAVTAPSCIWSDRRLGATEEVRVPIRNAWVVTGNNLSLTSELARRAVPIRLDAQVERPGSRSGFRHPDLLEYVKARRVVLAQACLIIAGNWVAAGRNEHIGSAVGSIVIASFEQWARRMGGILADAGVQGFLENHATFTEVQDEEGEELAELLAAWYEHTTEHVSKREIEMLLSPVGALGQHTPTALRASRELATALPYWLRKNRDRIAGGYKLELARRNGTARWWHVVRV